MSRVRAIGRIGVMAVSPLLYVSSLPLVAFVCADGRRIEGWVVLAWGWFGLLMLNPAWLANVVYAAAVLISAFRLYGVAAGVGAFAFGLGLFAFAAGEWYFSESGGTKIVRLGPAYYVWMASFGVMAAGNAWLAVARARAKESA